ncbi:hypothetical protein N181_02215 [Sinorhizobium fredii USDA 205]|uniref:Uncharacterized protein n=1 Tax=Rhizobium fredii TaxID=380 RepID=A0A844A8H4_RHIFR|nr:hypothetical protein [Sinorhizobium fredii]ASY73006.1 hypothetical protein SF83666_b63570 [Sinorhizobium fredii CCBAU 83666]KSV86074.1 hypothetical protein N181_02215 [Sinorhizobium fredii USDA 205]MQW97876.1 hypothetical protein [Sinorhizobium fredii]MQX09419.1 hypothetical protein [Sinorhizobium fredii]
MATANSVISAILRYGRVRRAAGVTDETSVACGRVEAGEPADRAGLCEGDVVLPIARPW